MSASTPTTDRRLTAPASAGGGDRAATAAAGPDAGRGRDAHRRPAAAAAVRVSRANLVLGGLGLASALFVIASLLESWRVTSTAASHRIAILGLSISYPAANLEAFVVVILAALGAVAVGRAIAGVAREVRVSRRLQHALHGEQPAALDGAVVIADAHPRAFCSGLVRPRVYISTGALTFLDTAAVGAVLAHERHHAHRHDPLRLAAGRVLADALFFLPGLESLVRRQQALAELSADESVVAAMPEQRAALARAMLGFSDAHGSDGSAGIDPARVDHLLGEPLSWGFPMLLCLVALAVLALLVTVAVLAGRVASGSATLAIPFLSRQPCILVLAATPCALGIAAASCRRRLATR